MAVWRHSTLCNIHIDTNMDMDMEVLHYFMILVTWSVEMIITLHGVYIHTDVNLHGVWRHSTLHNIHMDTMYGYVKCIISHSWSVEKFYNP